MKEAFKGEVMLLGWSESSQRGRTGSFLFDEQSEEHPLKQFTVKAGKTAGQRFLCVLYQINDDETIKEPVAPTLSQVAAMLCKDDQFWQWASERSFDTITSEQGARSFLLEKYQISSRSEFDHDAKLGHRFVQEIVMPFNEYRKAVNSPL